VALASAQELPPDLAAHDASIAKNLADCDARISRLFDSIEASAARDLVVPRLQAVQAERTRLEASTGRRSEHRKLSARDIAAWADELGGLVKVL